MKRRLFLRILTLGLVAAALILASCSTPETRISEHPDLYQSLSRRDQTLVTQGKIRAGMSRTAAWLAWGSPDQKVIGNMDGNSIETWVYTYYATYAYYPYCGPWDPYFGAPLNYPFCDSCFPPSIPYPGKVVTFAKSRVVSFHYIASR
jgi:hypothetical protein